ncbi:MAG: hypothetical protein QM530_07835 [Phycisphaerales bacterium]|nr:hypothetical protein [Phycisphaerales bacterium]
MRPQDIVILLKILSYNSDNWYNKTLSEDLFISTAEVSNSLKRSAVSGLIDTEKRFVRKQALLEFLIYGIQYVFPERAGGISRGMPTAHSHPLLQNKFISDQLYVWPDAESDEKGFTVQPLYKEAVKAAKKDTKLYLMLALLDMIRLGRVREKSMAIVELEKLINNESSY